jgi:hypothetical protein
VAESFDIAKLRRELPPTFYRHKKLMSDQVRWATVRVRAAVGKGR